MKIYGKSKLNEQMYDKMNKKADGIELHLENEIVKNLDKNIEDIFDLSYVDKVPIYVIHMPLTEDDINIETKLGQKVAPKVVELANYIARKQNHKVLIVMHFSTSVKKMKQLGLYDNLIFYLKKLIYNNPKIEIGIENVTILHQDSHFFSFYDCLLEDNIQLVKDVNHNRLGTVLDTCHVLQNQALLDYVKTFLDHPYIIDDKLYLYDLHTFFKENAPYVKLIHLANKITNGLMENHGTPFLDEDNNLLKEIMSYYKQYNYHCPITIEVKEDDYNDSKNFEITLKNLKNILKGDNNE